MPTSELEPRSCWECNRGKVLHLPCGLGDYIDCPSACWMSQSCAAKLLDTIDKPHRSDRPILNEFYKTGMSRKKLRLDRRRDFFLEIQPTVV